MERYQNMYVYTSGTIFIVITFDYRINHSKGDKQLTNSFDHRDIINIQHSGNILLLY